MLRSSNLDYSLWPPTNPGAITRLILVILAAANLVAAYFVLRPVGGSPQQLRTDLEDQRIHLRQKQAFLERTRMLSGKVETGRSQGEVFMRQYFLPRRAAYSIIVSELNDAATKAKIRPKESSFGFEPIDGSDVLSMMQISANFEGKYPDLMNFINLVDKSDRLLIIEAMTATPQQGGDLLNVNLKLDAFVAEDTLPQ